ncbi:hypothetical protein FCV25MIE_00467 [Fagus crenata]
MIGLALITAAKARMAATASARSGCFHQLLNSLITLKVFPEPDGDLRSFSGAGKSSEWRPTAAWAWASQSLVTTPVWAALVW